jgi:hypothetical protein
MFGHFAELFAGGAVVDGVVVVDGGVLVAAGVVVVVVAEELPDAALAIAALPPASAAVAATLAKIVASRLSIRITSFICRVLSFESSRCASVACESSLGASCASMVARHGRCPIGCDRGCALRGRQACSSPPRC